MKRSSQLTLDRYDTDKPISGYIKRYDDLFEELVDKEVNMLELGVFKGGSLSFWNDYFPRGRITGVDLNPPPNYCPPERVRVFQSNQIDLARLSQISNEVAPGGFDIIIDDASHVGHFTKMSFWHLLNNHLKPGGLFIIEDWGTGYWEDWMDGAAYAEPENDIQHIHDNLTHGIKTPFPNHSFGMVGFVKQLVDEIASADISDRQGIVPARLPRFTELKVFPGLVVVRKAP